MQVLKWTVKRFLGTSFYVLLNEFISIAQEHCETPYFQPRHRYLPFWNEPAKNSTGLASPYRCRTFRFLLTQIGYGLLCGFWVWRRRTRGCPCCPIYCLPLSNTSTSPWTAWHDGSGWWENRLAGEHLPRDLVRPSSGLKELAQTMTYNDSFMHGHQKKTLILSVQALNQVCVLNTWQSLLCCGFFYIALFTKTRGSFNPVV